MTATKSPRADRANETREAILSAAERLFAERGVFAVSNRQVSDQAGQGNNAAVGYHFGTKADLIRAIVRRHNEPVERLCEQMVDEVERNARAVPRPVRCARPRRPSAHTAVPPGR